MKYGEVLPDGVLQPEIEDYNAEKPEVRETGTVDLDTYINTFSQEMVSAEEIEQLPEQEYTAKRRFLEEKPGYGNIGFKSTKPPIFELWYKGTNGSLKKLDLEINNILEFKEISELCASNSASHGDFAGGPIVGKIIDTIKEKLEKRKFRIERITLDRYEAFGSRLFAEVVNERMRKEKEEEDGHEFKG